MFKLSKIQLQKKADELGFVRDTLEKVYRLIDILEFINKNNLTKDRLALKGGTAINLCAFDLPRLSVDIDLDFCSDCSKDKMIIEREKLKVVLEKYMIANSYSLSNKSKSFYVLDSFVWSYTNLAGNRDNIKIEINYLNRNHILETKWYSVCDVFSDTSVNCVDLAEIFA